MQKEFQQETDQAQFNEPILPVFSITIKVSDPELESGKGFYTYLISGSDNLGSYDIRRRYNDFFYFRESLAKRWPGIYIPPIPEKKYGIPIPPTLTKGSKDADNIQIRRKFFDFFMKRIGKIKHIFTCSITQQFLRNKGVEMQKFYSSMQPPKHHELIADYKKVYAKVDLTTKNLHEIRTSIQGFAGFLKKAEKELDCLRSQVQIIVDARAGFTSNLNSVNSTLLPDYEKNIYSEYLPEQEKKDPNLIFVSNVKVKNNISTLKQVSAINSFSVCLDHISYEILEVRAMEEALKIKQKYEAELKKKQDQLHDKRTEVSKLNSGSTTIKSLFTRGSKSNQIQKLQLDIPDIQKEISILQEFNSMVTIIFGKVELPIFKKNKQTQYYRMMYEISENEIKYMAAYGEFMKSVLQGVAR